MTEKNVRSIRGVPDYDCFEFSAKRSDFCLLIPIINEKSNITTQLKRAADNGIPELLDIIICDGGSSDGSTDHAMLRRYSVNTLLIKKGEGKQGAQLRTGLHLAMQRRYKGVLTIDGNNKDSIEHCGRIVERLRQGYDFVQGSRYLPGGVAENTPLLRHIAVTVIHAPVISLTAGERFTDTTNNFRGYSMHYLTHPSVKPLRKVFYGYELLAYLSTRASQLKLHCCEVPVERRYPKTGKVPTKISPIKGNIELMRILFLNAMGRYKPDVKK